MSVTCSTERDLQAAISAEGYAFVEGRSMRELLAPFASLADWPAFAGSWDTLEIDTYMADGGRYRRRRYGAWTASRDGVLRKPHQPHFQAIDYNPLNGGVERWFEPIAEPIGAGPSMTAILAFCRTLFSRLAPATPSWEIEVHQFRIEAKQGETGRPTPEGLHRDGVDYVLVLLVNRRNIARGMTSIHALDGRPLGHFTLTDPLDAALVDDTKVAHGVTAVAPINPSESAYRDVLVVTFRRDVRI